jgi:hypothetical protein
LAPLWFLAGVLCTLALIVLLLPWLRTIPGLNSLPQLPWPLGIAALVVLALAAVAYHIGGGPEAATDKAADAGSSASAWTDVARALQAGTAAPDSGAGAAGAAKPAAPMSAAVASLEARLANGGGSPDDWELLAKSYEFMGRPADAAQARAHKLPVQSVGSGLSGEVTLADALRGKATDGATLFIVAKSVSDPGPPVAVLRSVVHDWPVKFRLDDTLAMLPGRTLSSAGSVTLEARISQSGQALAVSGDLQGSVGPVSASQPRSLSIVIDKVVK